MKKFNFFIQTQNFKNERVSIEAFKILRISPHPNAFYGKYFEILDNF